jgi:hypothetical protein
MKFCAPNPQQMAPVQLTQITNKYLDRLPNIESKYSAINKIPATIQVHDMPGVESHCWCGVQH